MFHLRLNNQCTNPQSPKLTAFEPSPECTVTSNHLAPITLKLVNPISRRQTPVVATLFVHIKLLPSSCMAQSDTSSFSVHIAPSSTFLLSGHIKYFSEPAHLVREHNFAQSFIHEHQLHTLTSASPTSLVHNLPTHSHAMFCKCWTLANQSSARSRKTLISLRRGHKGSKGWAASTRCHVNKLVTGARR